MATAHRAEAERQENIIMSEMTSYRAFTPSEVATAPIPPLIARHLSELQSSLAQYRHSLQSPEHMPVQPC